MKTLLLKFFFKLFDKDKYKKMKITSQINSDKLLFKDKYENYIYKIQDNLKKKKRDFIPSFWAHWRYHKYFTSLAISF